MQRTSHRIYPEFVSTYCKHLITQVNKSLNYQQKPQMPFLIFNIKKKVKINLEFNLVSYICTRILEEKFELIATSLKKC
jgi:hypothetical protein